MINLFYLIRYSPWNTAIYAATLWGCRRPKFFYLALISECIVLYKTLNGLKLVSFSEISVDYKNYRHC